MQYTLEWDPNKARDNEAKHGISFERAAEVQCANSNQPSLQTLAK